MRGKLLSNDEFSVVETTIVIFVNDQFHLRQVWTFKGMRVEPEVPHAA